MNTTELPAPPLGTLWSLRVQSEGKANYESCTVSGLEEVIVPEPLYVKGTIHRSPAKPSALESAPLTEPSPVGSCTDIELIELVRCEPPSEAALDALVARYWDSLFARCYMLTSNRDKASDLAQATWCRVLRNRSSLKPDGNFPAYLATVARNLFRDSYRAARRAGPLAEHRLESLESAHTNDGEEAVILAEIVPDVRSMGAEERTLLAIDIDRALEHLTPQLRDVLVARFIDGESCAEIGRRYGRTEQAVSGWIRGALRQMKTYLEGPGPAGNDGYIKIRQEERHQL